MGSEVSINLNLLLLLLVCHWLGDFTHLSTPAMLKAKEKGTPVLPIVLHAGVHAILMFLVLMFFIPFQAAVFLMLFEWVTHFALDLLKGKSNVWFPQLSDSKNPFHWYIFGIDQILHIVVIIFIAVLAKVSFLIV
ncbi:MAG: hypothetical protein Fur0041_11500 [Bacteroidia bacterium]